MQIILLGIMPFIRIEIENAALKGRKPTAAMTSNGCRNCDATVAKPLCQTGRHHRIVELNRRVDI